MSYEDIKKQMPPSNESDRIIQNFFINQGGSYTQRTATDGNFNATYGNYFEIGMVVHDEKFFLTLHNFQVNLFGANLPLEDFRNRKFPEIPPAYQIYTTYIFKMYSYVPDDINIRAGEIKDAQKYIAKAKKKGLI